jgi:hypothetical protein
MVCVCVCVCRRKLLPTEDQRTEYKPQVRADGAHPTHAGALGQRERSQRPSAFALGRIDSTDEATQGLQWAGANPAGRRSQNYAGCRCLPAFLTRPCAHVHLLGPVVTADPEREGVRRAAGQDHERGDAGQASFASDNDDDDDEPKVTLGTPLHSPLPLAPRSPPSVALPPSSSQAGGSGAFAKEIMH